MIEGHKGYVYHCKLSGAISSGECSLCYEGQYWKQKSKLGIKNRGTCIDKNVVRKEIRGSIRKK